MIHVAFRVARMLCGAAPNPARGRWLIAPKQQALAANRRYRPGTLVLETEFRTKTARAVVVDFMPFGGDAHLLRIETGYSSTNLAVERSQAAAYPEWGLSLSG